MSESTVQPTRRRFFFEAGLAGAGLWAAGRSQASPPSESVRVGMIGLGNQGMNNLKAFMKNVVAVSDVDSSRLAGAKKVVESVGGKSCDSFGDFRRLLDRQDIHALVITTHDPWHPL